MNPWTFRRQEKKCQRARRRARFDSGQSLVEFAIVIPLLLGVLLGMVEFARAWQIKQVVTNTAREGARVGVISGTTNATIQTAMDNYMTSANVDMANTTYSIANIVASAGTSDTITVNYNYQYQWFGPVVKLLTGGSSPGSVTLTSTSIMRNE